MLLAAEAAAGSLRVAAAESLPLMVAWVLERRCELHPDDLHHAGQNLEAELLQLKGGGHVYQG